MDSRTFEQEVHRIASALWPSAKGSPNRFVEGREVDGFYETDDIVHLIECTTRTDKQKATEDGRKLLANVKRYQQSHRQKAVKGWFITLKPPTAHQRKEIDKHNNPALTTISFADFQARLINARQYIMARQQRPFGSARHPDTLDIDPGEYIPLDIQETPSGDLWTIDDLVDGMRSGHRFVVLGDFGAGKSMTLREMFHRLSELHLKNEDAKFPIHLNLRDHKGQDSAEEALLRHADRCGYEDKHSLIRAWRAGYAHIVLDGFDEISSFTWQGDFHRIVALRRRALSLVREFMQETTSDAGVLVAGRSNYFDSRREADQALGPGVQKRTLTLNEFTDEQIQSYLARQGWTEPVPAWVPARPLLLGILATRDVLPALLGLGEQRSPAEAWHYVLDLIFEREATQQASLDGGSIRRVMERLAALTRARPDGLGPVYADDTANAFRATLGYPPDDEAIQVLLRLPLLSVGDEADASRQFIDEDLVDLLRVGPTVEYCLEPYTDLGDIEADSWSAALGEQGIDSLQYLLEDKNISSSQIAFGVGEAARLSYYALALDLLRVLLTRDDEGVLSNVEIRNQEVRHLELSCRTANLSAVTLRDCFVERLNLELVGRPELVPRFRGCIVVEVIGPRSADELPEGVFIDCEFGEFAPRTVTTQGIMELPLPIGARVALTILKKLYAQRGRGRAESALSRGLSHSARGLVSDVCDILGADGFVVAGRASGQAVWLPTRERAKDARQILANPALHKHEVLRRAAAIGD